jgi:hypothetical protein
MRCDREQILITRYKHVGGAAAVARIHRSLASRTRSSLGTDGLVRRTNGAKNAEG